MTLHCIRTALCCTGNGYTRLLLVTKAADYLQWAGMDILLKKCGVTAMDMRNGQRVATDGITLSGQPIPVIFPNQSHKHSSLRMAIDGNFLAEKEHVRSDIKQRL